MRNETTEAEKFRQFTGETTLHGIRHTCERESGYFRRLVWVALLLLAAGWSFYNIASHIQVYFRYPVTTDETVVDVESLSFPAVTICNANKVRTSYARQFPFVEEALRFSSHLNRYIGIPETFDLNNTTIRTALEQVNATNLFSKGAEPLDQMFQHCLWRSQEVPCGNIFTETYTNGGTCFTFNSAEIIKKQGPEIINQTGTRYSLRLGIHLHQEEYMLTQESFRAGIKVLLHDPSTEPVMDRFGFTASPGFTTFANAKMVKVEYLPKPYQNSDCLEKMSPGFVNPLSYYPDYSREACKLECERNYTVRECGCLAPGYRGNDVKSCNVLQYVECASPKADDYHSRPEIERACGCEQTCHDTYYEQLLSTAVSPSATVIKNVYVTMDREFYQQNILELLIYFDRLSYKSVRQQPSYPTNSLLADIGGHLGLWLGASVFTLIEFIEFGLLRLVNCIKRSGESSKRTAASTHGLESPTRESNIQITTADIGVTN